MSYHIPVLLKESMAYLNLKAGGVYVDATLGGGGHTEAMLSNKEIKQVYAFDQDEDAISYTSNRLKKYQERLTLIKANFADMRTELALRRVKSIDGILFDLGVSSHQLDTAERGFSFDKDGRLDMRMDRQTEQTARDILNNMPTAELARIFRQYGEEQAAYKIAGWIVAARKSRPLETTGDLTAILESNMRSNPILITKTKARIFQALRIYLNRELEVLASTLNDAINLLNPAGRMVVISYHSLEDRIVKTSINEAARGCICPKTVLKCVCNIKPRVKNLTPRTIQASAEEIKKNGRARSAKLRAVEKIQGVSR
jgi:16S rRNA (cytosine1402-N4)-methyltransferase